MLVWYLVNRPSLWRPVSWGRGGSRICGAAVLSTPSIISSVMVVSSFLIKIISANTVHSGLYYRSQQCLIAAFRRTAHNAADEQHYYWVRIVYLLLRLLLRRLITTKTVSVLGLQHYAWLRCRAHSKRYWLACQSFHFRQLTCVHRTSS